MRTAIATVSIGGTLADKLEVIAAAGFEGVEIFETDILGFDGTPVDVGRTVSDLGLEIIAFQPFRDFEGMPEPQRSRGFERAKRKLELMAQLGAPRLLVCSNVSPLSQGGIDRSAEDLRALGELARPYGIQIGFEALAWGRQCFDYRDAWEIVRRADHPHVGVILDSWHILSRKLPVDDIRRIPADRITFVQLADSPRIEMDLLHLSRHFRNFPGQGEFDIRGFMAALIATGYDGWLSHEIFNDQFRMALPRRIATDGERSLIWLLNETTGQGDLAPRVPVKAVEWIEFAASDEEGAQLAALFEAMGFTRAGRHKSKDVERWLQGSINFVINTEKEGFAHSHSIVHGTSVCAIGLRVDDAAAAMQRARALKAETFFQPVGLGELEIPAIRGLGGSLIYFVDDRSDLARVWEVEFAAPPGNLDGASLTGIDHVSQSMPDDELLTWRLFYLSLFDVDKTPQVDVVDPAGIVTSQVVQNAERSVRICLNSSASRQTMAARFLSEYFGAGVQHIALATADIFKSVERLRDNGVELLPIPDNYYDDLEARLGLDPQMIDRLRSLDILYDEDEKGRYFQVYTQVFAEFFFFEIIEREGAYEGFGAANAPIRLAAQTRAARHPTIPRQ